MRVYPALSGPWLADLLNEARDSESTALFKKWTVLVGFVVSWEWVGARRWILYM
jgi:hypothetical protein